MAPKSLFSFSTSLSTFSLTHKLNPNPNSNPLLQNPHKSTPIFFCKLQISSTTTNVSTPIIEISGTGAAAPTRGDVFLSRQQSIEAASITKSKKPKKPKKKPKISTDITCCYGCGAPLQIIEVDAPGYVDPPTYELKKKHRLLKTVLCGRCKLLSHGHMITAVGGNGGYSGGKQFVTADELRQKLSHLRDEKLILVLLTTQILIIRRFSAVSPWWWSELERLLVVVAMVFFFVLENGYEVVGTSNI
ncbi:nitric-oxide synthase (NADPH) [Ranunculus cassubicifolius]